MASNVQILVTPETIKNTGVKHTANMALLDIKRQGEIGLLSIYFVDGIPMPSIRGVIKRLLPVVSCPFLIMTHIKREEMSELIDDSELLVRYTDLGLN